MFGGKENSEYKTDRQMIDRWMNGSIDRSEIGITKPAFSEMGTYKLKK